MTGVCRTGSTRRARSTPELGGYIGSVEAGHVFVTGVSADELEVTVIDGDAVPEILWSTPRDCLDPALVLVDDDLVVVGTPQGVVISRPGEPPTVVPTDQRVLAVSRHGDTLLTTIGTPDVGCL